MGRIHSMRPEFAKNQSPKTDTECVKDLVRENPQMIVRELDIVRHKSVSIVHDHLKRHELANRRGTFIIITNVLPHSLCIWPSP